MRKRHLTVVALLAVLLSWSLTSAQQKKQTEASPTSGHETAVARNLYVFNALVKELENTYVDSIRTDEAFKIAIAAMLNTVDPYTEYFASDDKEALLRMTTGAYGGIGAVITERDGDTYIYQPLVGTPSFNAGMKAGDKLLRVDSVDVTGKRSENVTRLLKGEPGTRVKVTVMRPYTPDSILTFDITRERVQEKSVPYYGVIDGNIGFIRLNSFMEKSPEEVRIALESFKGNPAVESIILDLRGNGGGLVESAIDILGNFLPKGTEVLQTRGKEHGSNKTYKTTHAPIFPDAPLAVLIDGGSASASEITAGALQDLDRAVLVGKRSFGKGLVQGTYPLPYDGLLKITTAKYYIPSGRLIQALDYSQRNPDGSVARTPDSLTNEFLTKNGRIVRDGGGLKPDTTVTPKEYSRLISNLVLNNLIFDFATKYAATHTSIPSPGEFRITDEIFDDFVAGIDTTKVKSDKIGKDMVEELKKAAKTEGFMTPELEEALKALSPLVEPDLKRDLYNKRDEISFFLGQEIVSRYYSDAGETEFSLNFDDDLEVAKNILKDKSLYRNILNPKPKSGKKGASRK